jgi:anti-anti-sigma factor
MGFTIHSTALNNCSIFKLKGRILTDEDLAPAHAMLENRENWNLVLDLSELTHTNSTGIAFMVKCLTKSRVHSGDTVLLQPNASLSRLFEITKMHEVFTILMDLESAINYYKK